MLKTYTRKQRQEDEIIEDIHELCRLCLTRAHEAVPIFGEVDNACAALPMRIMICVGHEITQNDSLPNSICTNCNQELDRYYKFRKICENSYLKLKSHYNAIRYRDKITKLHTENKEHNNKQAMCELQECQTQAVEPQTDEMERLVIVDVYNVDENSEYKKPMDGSVSEPIVKSEDKEDETTEIQVIQQADDVNPDISTFLSAILVELGILVRSDQGLVVQDQGVTSFELETGDDEQLEFELVEEDEVGEPMEALTIFPMAEVRREPQSIADSKPKEKTKKNRVRKKAADCNDTWCAECGRGFASLSARRRHGAVHSGARPHACPRCGRRFAQKAVMERHKLVHEAVRPFQCSACCKSFTQRGTLAQHARAHAAPHARALALHACTRCDRVFLYASGLSRHMVSHSGHGFSCIVCQRMFNDKSSLIRHTRTTHPHPAPF